VVLSFNTNTEYLDGDMAGEVYVFDLADFACPPAQAIR